MEKLQFDFDVKDIGASGEFEGWASIHTIVDLGNDKVLPGAFATTLRKSKGVVPVLFNHDRNQIVGVGVDAQEDSRGLYVRAKLAMGTQLGRETHELMSIGALKGLSIGYTVPQKGFVMDGDVRLLKTIELHEYSATPFPMMPDARISRVKCLSTMTARELEDQLRDVFGLSQREAKTAIAEGFKNLMKGQRDVETEQDEDDAVRLLLKNMRDEMDTRAMLSSMISQF